MPDAHITIAPTADTGDGPYAAPVRAAEPISQPGTTPCHATSLPASPSAPWNAATPTRC